MNILCQNCVTDSHVSEDDVIFTLPLKESPGYNGLTEINFKI